MLLCAIIYKAKIGVTNFLLKVAMKRVLSRSAARSVLPFLAVVGTAFWNGAVAIRVPSPSNGLAFLPLIVFERETVRYRDSFMGTGNARGKDSLHGSSDCR